MVDTRGAKISDPPEPHGERDIYLPQHVEFISHVAIDIGGSLAKVVYFTRAPRRTDVKGKGPSRRSSGNELRAANGVLEPKAAITNGNAAASSSSSPTRTTPTTHRALGAAMRRRSSTSTVPGGRLNFVKFETDRLDECIAFISDLIEASAGANNVPLEAMKRSVKIMATGGGAHLHYEQLQSELGVEVQREEEMDCLITGLTFVTEIPHEVFFYSDELVDSAKSGGNPPLPTPNAIGLNPSPSREYLNASVAMSSHSDASGSSPSESPSPPLERPSPNPPQYSVVFESRAGPQFPCMLVNIGSGVSIIKVTDFGKFERISGTSLGGGTLWGLLSLLTGAETFDEMLALSEKGDNASVDMLVGDIYGSDYSKIGLKSTTIASSFGKVFRKGKGKRTFRPEDISRSLLYAISNNIGQIAFMNAAQHDIDHIYFGGCFIRGHPAIVNTLSYATRFWSKGTKRALFLRHEGYLGSIGAWLKNLDEEGVAAS